MNNKKIIVRTALIALLIIVGVFLSKKISGYLSLKNDCLQHYSKPEGYSFSLYFEPEPSQADVDKFINEVEKISHVKNIQSETIDERLQEFLERHKDEPEIINSINNNLRSLLTITINSDISNIDDFLKFEQGILDKVGNSGLAIQTHYDGNLIFFQTELVKVRNASLIKDLPGYIFLEESNYFFKKKYNVNCIGPS